MRRAAPAASATRPNRACRTATMNATTLPTNREETVHACRRARRAFHRPCHRVPRYVKPEAIAKRGHFKGRNVAPGKASPMELLPEIGEKRFKSLDDAGITVQVLSNSGAGPDLSPARTASRSRRRSTTTSRCRHQTPQALRRLCRAADGDPRRLRQPNCRRAVKDLKMVGAMIHGTTEGRFLDHPSYDGLLAAAVELDVPIYIHPNVPSMDVRRPITPTCPRAPTAWSRPPAGAGIRRSRSTSCAWCSPAPSTSTRSSR